MKWFEIGLVVLTLATGRDHDPPEVGGHHDELPRVPVAQHAHERRDVLIVVAERERIARDLHDHVIQALFATSLNLSAALRAPDHADATHKISTSIKSLDATTRQIRATIFDLQHRICETTTARAVVKCAR